MDIEEVLDNESILNDNESVQDEECDETQSFEENIENDEDDNMSGNFQEGDLINSNGELIDPLKKKRGRKPKQKTEEPVLKKRGRKPKIKEEMDEEEKVPKKRGRKPKEKTYSVNEGVSQDSTTVIDKSETVILHLPIRQDASDIS